jgi:maleylacetoacetate isomerase
VPIIEYLNETRPQGASLLPSDPIKRAKARALAEIVNSGIQPYQKTSVVKRFAEQYGEEKKNEWVYTHLNNGFRAFEEMLKETSGKYCVGDEVSIADMCLVPQVYAGFKLDNY